MTLLIDQDNEPTKSLYFLGAKVIHALMESNFGVVDPNVLFRAVNDGTVEAGAKVSYDYFMLTLDWLFLLGKINLDEKGDIIKCF